MKSLRSLSKKSDIQHMYDFVCYSIERGFNAIVIDKNNNVKSNDIAKIWVNEKNIPAIKKSLNKILTSEEFNVFKNAPSNRLLMLVFYIKNAILKEVVNIPSEDVLNNWEDLFNYINMVSSIDSVNIASFAQWIKASPNDIKSAFAKQEHIINNYNKEFNHGTSFFKFLRQNIQVKPLSISTEISNKLKSIKHKFRFKSIIIYPGRCPDVLAALNRVEKQFSQAAAKLGLPNEAMGLNKMNVAFYLDDELPNLSLIHSKVEGFFFYKNKEFNICIRNCNNDTVANTIVHEYGHFISSIIYETTKEREENSILDLNKWGNDTITNASDLAKAHNLKLNWVSKNLSLCSWDEFHKMKQSLSDDNGYRYLEHNFVSILLGGIAKPSEKFLASEPVIHDKMMRNYNAYLEGIRLKLVNYGIIRNNFFFPQSNIDAATQFFLEQSSFIYFKHEIKNPYLKGLFQMAFIDGFVFYEANPEEVWARSFEVLTNTNKSKNFEYKSFVNKKFHIDFITEEMYKPEFNLNSMDRLHILYIIKFVITEYLPDITFNPKESRCYKEFLENNIIENERELAISRNILDKTLKYIAYN